MLQMTLGMAFSQLALAVLLVIVFFGMTIGAIPNTTMLNYRCGAEIDPLSLEWDAINTVIVRLIRQTQYKPSYKYNTREPVSNTLRKSCYGHAKCSRQLPRVDCLTCLEAADTKIIQECGMARSARMQLQDCYLRFSLSYFEEH
ncbi:hypothetical protein MLD38_006786 [Melastoma candidum]|uniref:Uncharacterized protein n=1 Tax=Melastoma candidum TaxID=119954 RepID=A0ACB9RPJ9_9MYRT|nr:hypothetical protein MLD38_006786 [Melastoma candidum]